LSGFKTEEHVGDMPRHGTNEARGSTKYWSSVDIPATGDTIYIPQEKAAVQHEARSGLVEVFIISDYTGI